MPISLTTSHALGHSAWRMNLLFIFVEMPMKKSSSGWKQTLGNYYLVLFSFSAPSSSTIVLVLCNQSMAISYMHWQKWMANSILKALWQFLLKGQLVNSLCTTGTMLSSYLCNGCLGYSCIWTINIAFWIYIFTVSVCSMTNIWNTPLVWVSVICCFFGDVVSVLDASNCL